MQVEITVLSEKKARSRMRNVTSVLEHGVQIKDKRHEVEETFCEEEEEQQEERRGECGVHVAEGPDSACIKNVVMGPVTLDNEYMLIKVNKTQQE